MMRWPRRRDRAQQRTAAEFGAPPALGEQPQEFGQQPPMPTQDPPSQGDDMTMHHCPRCGSGGITGGSDGSITCSFCQLVFKVYAQPTHPFMPQTINGQPYQSPGQQPLSTDPLPASDGAIVEPPVSNPTAGPGAAAPGGGLERFRVDGGAPGVEPELQAAAMVTHMGVALPFDSFIAHLAIRHADDPAGVIEQVRASRG